MKGMVWRMFGASMKGKTITLFQSSSKFHRYRILNTNLLCPRKIGISNFKSAFELYFCDCKVKRLREKSKDPDQDIFSARIQIHKFGSSKMPFLGEDKNIKYHLRKAIIFMQLQFVKLFLSFFSARIS